MVQSSSIFTSQHHLHDDMTYMTPRSEVTNVKCKTHLLHSAAALHFGELEELREFWGNKTSKGFAGPGLAGSRQLEEQINPVQSITLP